MEGTFDDNDTLAIGISLVLISTCAIVGNALLLVTVATVRRSVGETLLMMLSLLECAFCVLVMPLSTIAYLTEWNIGDEQSVCDFQGTVSFATKFSSTFIITLICLERYFCIASSRTMTNKSSSDKLSVVFCACVVSSFLLGAVPLIAGIRMKTFEETGSYCHFDITPSSNISKTYTIVVVVLEYIMIQASIFSFVSVLCNWEPFVRAYGHSTRNRAAEQTVEGYCQRDVQTILPNQAKHTKQSIEYMPNVKLSRMLLTVAFLHWCSYLPFMVLMAVTQINGSVSPKADFIAVYTISIQTALHPILVFVMFRPYRRALNCIVRRNTHALPVVAHSTSLYLDVSHQDISVDTRDMPDFRMTSRDVGVQSFTPYCNHNPPSQPHNDFDLKKHNGCNVTSPVKHVDAQATVNIKTMIKNYDDCASESLTCSTCPVSEHSDIGWTEDFDSDFSEYSYTTEEGLQGIIYIDRGTRKIIPLSQYQYIQETQRKNEKHQDKHTTQRPYPIDVSSSGYTTPDSDAVLQNYTGIMQKPELSNVTVEDSTVCNHDDKHIRDIHIQTAQTVLPDDNFTSKTDVELEQSESRQRQIIGRRELRRLGIKIGRVAKTFKRGSIPQETSLYNSTNQPRVCIVCKGRYGRCVPHSKHMVNKTDDEIEKESPVSEKVIHMHEIRGKDPKLMNVLFQKALDAHKHGRASDTELFQPQITDFVLEYHDSNRVPPSRPKEKQATGSGDKEDFNYLQFIRCISSSKQVNALYRTLTHGTSCNVLGSTRRNSNMVAETGHMNDCGNRNQQITEEGSFEDIPETHLTLSDNITVCDQTTLPITYESGMTSIDIPKIEITDMTKM